MTKLGDMGTKPPLLGDRQLAVYCYGVLFLILLLDLHQLPKSLWVLGICRLGRFNYRPMFTC